jgi:hypothetical protein
METMTLNIDTVLPVLLLGLLVGGAGLLVYRALRLNQRARGTSRTSDDPQRVDPDFVEVSFTALDGARHTVEHYYDKKIYKTPQDFVRLNREVTVKYRASNPRDCVIGEYGFGSHVDSIVAALIGALIGGIAASQSAGELYPTKAAVFSKVFLGVALGVLVLLKLSPYFAWLNMFRKRDDDD